jgi:hypothetical protein
MEQIYKDRWTTLFEYLEGVELAEFNMSSFIDKEKGTRCAAGYLPVVFPQEWRMDTMDEPVLISRPVNTSRAVCDFLDIDPDIAFRLFSSTFRGGWTPLDWIEHAKGVLEWEKDEANP